MISLEWGGGLVGLLGSCVLLGVSPLSGGVTVITSVCWGTSAQKQWAPCQTFLSSRLHTGTAYDPCGWHHTTQHSSRCKPCLYFFLVLFPSYRILCSRLSFSLLSLSRGRARSVGPVQEKMFAAMAGGRREHPSSDHSTETPFSSSSSASPPQIAAARAAHAQRAVFSVANS